MIFKAIRVNKVAVPLRFYEDITSFKLFFIDVGLLCCMADVPAPIILGGNDSLTEYKGMLTEEYVAQQLSAVGMNLYYWSNDRTPAELDFIIQSGEEVYPIEVKASTNVRGKSLARFLNENPERKGLRFSLLGYKEQDRLTNIPLFMIDSLAEFL